MSFQETRVAVVTGANRGIGFAVAKNLAKMFNGQVYVTARNERDAEEAVIRLKSEGITNCEPHQLDISDQNSIDKLKAHLSTGLDVLVNNAGIICTPERDLPMKVQLKNTVDVNYFGTLNLCNALFDLIKPGGRVINVTSDWGCIFYVKNLNIREQLLQSDLTVEKINSIMNEFISVAQAPEYHNDIYEAYMVSKNGLNALTNCQQRMLDEKRAGEGIIVSAVHPGEVTTDMNKEHGTIMPDEGSETIVWLAIKESSPNVDKGKFWYLKKVLDWSDPNLDLSVFH